MKKKVLLIVMLCMGFVAKSQINFGAKLGMNRTNIKDIHGSSDPRYGFQIGAFAQIPFNSEENQFYIQPELNYSQQGEKNQGDGVDEIYKFDYLTIPVLFRAYFSEEEDEFFGEIGPQFGFLISDKVDILNNATIKENPNEKYNGFDMGATAGIGFSLNRKFEIFARYYVGFVDVVENDIRNKKNWNSNLQASVAYIF